MAQMQRGSFPNITTLRGIHMVIQHDWDAREAVGRKLFNVYDSTQYQEDTQTMGAAGLFTVKPEGTSIDYVDINEGFRETFTHVTYGLGFRITEEMRDDELYGVMENMAKDLAFSADATEESLLASHFNNATSTSYLGPDGVALLSTAHVREDGSTYGNMATADLAKTSLESALIAFRNFRDGGGKRLAIKPVTLLVPPDYQFTAARLLNSTMNPTVDYSASGDGESAVNPINGLGLSLQVWDYITNTDDWFLLAKKEQHKMTMYDRKPFSTDFIFDFDTGDYKIKATFRQSSGWADPRGLYGSDGTT